MTEASSKLANNLTHGEELRDDWTRLRCGNSSHRREEQEILDVRIQVFAICLESSNLNNDACTYTWRYPDEA